ncbi:MAG: aspartate ammonia-lyase [Proteobacteria bacterium]|nr:aspartate ammonia-lyase [Pseudomonadota bacterium]
MGFRTEHDLLGEYSVPENALYGVHTARSAENFSLTGRRVHPAWIHAMGDVKHACARTSRKLGAWKDDAAKADAIEAACVETAQGKHDDAFIIDPLQGGAGTSLNMNANEVIANRALEILGLPYGTYSRVSPLDDINYQQSTNDVCPTAYKVALIRQIDMFLPHLKSLELTLRQKAEEFKDIVKVGRTQYQDAVLTTLGFEFKAYAEALFRDFARMVQARKALLKVNLGGTAIGTCVSASHEYVENVVPALAEITGIDLSQTDDLIDGTQNLDDSAYVSGILKTLAVSLLKMSTDLRFMSSGPQAGIAEIMLPPRQAGSSIMPGKVNPVIPEAMTQACFTVIGHDTAITYATSQGNLELNAFLPLIADCLLNDLDMLAKACKMLTEFCIRGIMANVDKCRAGVASSTALITAMVARIGYDRACQIGIDAIHEGKSIRDKLLELKLLSEAEIEALTSADVVRSTMADKARHSS